MELTQNHFEIIFEIYLKIFSFIDLHFLKFILTLPIQNP